MHVFTCPFSVPRRIQPQSAQEIACLNYAHPTADKADSALQYLQWPRVQPLSCLSDCVPASSGEGCPPTETPQPRGTFSGQLLLSLSRSYLSLSSRKANQLLIMDEQPV